MSYRLCKKGFTLVELVVVLVIIGIVSAIGIPTASHFIKNAEYRKNEENAKTAYLAAESVLTWYRTSGQWDAFREKVVADGVPNPDTTFNGRIYAVSVNPLDGKNSHDLAMELLEGGVYSSDFFAAEIVIELDVESGQVYSAFYGTRCNSLTYGGAVDGTPSIAVGESRKPEVRREVLLGYYSVEDVSNVVELKQVRLKVTTINLINSETLSLNWTSNSRNNNLDVKYIITFYEKDGGNKLFSTEVELSELTGALASVDTGDASVSMKTGMAGLELKVPDAAALNGERGIGKWNFPLTYQQAGSSSGRFSLVLDGMMTAELAEAVEAKVDPEVAKKFSTSITRLGGDVPDLKLPQDVYVEVQVQPAYRESGSGTGITNITEYKTSSPVRSNTENTLFAKAEMTGAVGAETLNAEITRYRHLSNIRYYDKAKAAEFILTAKNLDWTSAGAGMYGVTWNVAGVPSGGGKVGWCSAVEKDKVTGKDKVLDFPSIPLLGEEHTLQGNKAQLSNLHLGAESVPNDEQIGKLYVSGTADSHYSHYLGLFCEAKGAIKELTLTDPVLRLVGGTAGAGSGGAEDGSGDGTGGDPAAVPEAVENFDALYGVGILCGRNEGSLVDIAVKTTQQEHQTVFVCLKNRDSETGQSLGTVRKPAGIGGLVGVLAGKAATGSSLELAELTGGAGTTITLSGLTTEGKVTGYLPSPEGTPSGGAPVTPDPAAPSAEERAKDYPYGVGGIVGYAWIGNGGAGGSGIQLTECKNYGDINGNLFTGGIVGTLQGDYDNAAVASDVVSIQNGYNEGLVLCLVNYKEEENKLEGRYFGGIAGYGEKAQISSCVNASKYREEFDDTKKDGLLHGHYVGGIIGYGANSRLSGCSTQRGSYVLGSHYVGGIAGGLSNDLQKAITGTPGAGIQVTTNGGYVIGDRYVGGIVGKNDGTASTTIENCINNGVAAGYERYIGGIVGYNGKNGTIKDCASYFSDNGGFVFRMIVDKWKATGDFAGGLAGYNNGMVEFATNPNIQVESVASIVVGEDYVGGVIGFNDIDGGMKVAYKLMGGQIHGYGNAVGGCIGFNASKKILTEELTISPTSITGNYHVGGVIGANVVDVTPDAGSGSEVAMTKVKADNRLGSIKGNAFTGGVIGYQRTYTDQQLKDELNSKNAGWLTAAGSEALGGKDGNALLLLSYIDGIEETKGTGGTEGAGGTGKAASNGEGDASQTEQSGNETAGNLLPLLDKTKIVGTDTPKNVPTEVLVSKNEHIFTIGDQAKNEEDQQVEYNNIPIYSDLYTGGIVGYCERESRLHIVNSKNAGSLSRLSASAEGKGVVLGDYLTSAEVGLKEADIKELEEEDKALELSVGGGIIGANLENQIIDHCVNTGIMNDFVGLGGIVGFNAGGVFNCQLSDNFGNLGLNYIGGIAGLNVHAVAPDESQDGIKRKEFTYTDVNGMYWEKFVSGTIAKCSTQKDKTISGKNYVGGIVGFNMAGAEMMSNRNNANVTGAGSYVGGMAGANSGSIFVAKDDNADLTEYAITGNSGEGIGGIVGWNKAGGSVDVISDDNDEAEIVAIDKNVSINGKERVGGIIGLNEGALSAESKDGKERFLVCQAKIVHATDGYAGGIIGEARRKEKDPAQDQKEMDEEARISGAVNKSESVTADRGPAGGIVAVNQKRFWLESCTNLGNVNSDNGYAGGITAENYGWIWRCKVGDKDKEDARITISSHGVDSIGAVCAVNYGQIWKSAPEKSKAEEADKNKNTVILSGTADIVGGIAGLNAAGGQIGIDIKQTEDIIGDTAYNMTYMPHINISSAALTVGGAAGQNQSAQSGTDAGEDGKDAAVIQNVTADGLVFEKFNNYKYLGGIAGENQNGALVEDCVFANGEIRQDGGTAAGNCYGGVAGSNDGRLRDCQVEGITINVAGIYTATSTSTAQEKENRASHIGGIAGKNEKNGVILGCLIAMGKDKDGKDKANSITVKNGMAGGVAGYNKNRITLSGDEMTDDLMQKQRGDDGSISAGVVDVKTLIRNAEGKGAKADPNYVEWSDGGNLEDQNYYSSSWNKVKVSADRSLQLMMSNNGNLGGITAYNAPAGEVSYCATGDWFLNNKSQALGVGTGGIIGMNESEKNLAFLLNRAFVGRQLNSGDTNRFAGGIIGSQNNTTKDGWMIQNCVNYGTIYCRYTHYAGGIMGQWTGTGGNIEKCYNFGNMQTTQVVDWLGASGGIVAQLYHAYENNEYNITGCANYGSIYSRAGENIENCANDSAGILGNVTTYKNATNDEKNGQNFTINVTDCVNGAGVKIYSKSMASGIVGFFSVDNAQTDKATYVASSTANIKLNIERCRNYAQTLYGYWHVAGIFGDRYGKTGAENTTVKYCFSVNLNRATDGYMGYYDQPRPIISFKNGNSVESGINYILDKDMYYNFFLSERDKINSFPTTSFNNSGKDNVAMLRRANSDWIYSVVLDGVRYFMHIDNAGTDDIRLTSQNNSYYLRVVGNDVYKDYKDWWGNVTQGSKIGRVLFKIDDATDVATYSSMDSIVKRVKKSDGTDFDYLNNFDSYVREFCFTEAGLLLAPEKVVLSKTDDGQFKLEVDTSGYADTGNIEYVAQLYRRVEGAASGEERINVSSIVQPSSGVTVDTMTNTFQFGTETCTFGLLDTEIANGGQLFVRLVAREKNNPDKESSEVESNSVPLGSVLPEPELRIELVEDKDNKEGYAYRFRLANQKAYEDYKNEHEAYKDYTFKAHVRLMDGTELGGTGGFDIDKTVSHDLGTASLQQLVVWVTAERTTPADTVASAEVSIPVYLPCYKPEIAINNPVRASAVVTGDSLKDLTITVTLTGPGGNITTPPVYRAELVGTWEEKDDTGAVKERHTDYVFCTADILTVASGTVNAVFTDFEDLPEEEAEKFADAEDIKVRVWYAQSGLGPVYTYYYMDMDGMTPNTRTEETVTNDQGEEETQWLDAYTSVLVDGTFANYRWTSGSLFEWLDAPVLMTIPDGESLQPETNPYNGHLQYTFTWDEDIVSNSNDYIVTLTGVIIDDDGNRGNPISIVTDREVKGGTLTLDAEDWPYREVELSVTRKGYKQWGTTYIGKTSSKTYPVKKRLPRPEQPRVTNPDVDELDYVIEWSPVSPEIGEDTQNPNSGCISYEIYIRPVTPRPEGDPDGDGIQRIPVNVKKEDDTPNITPEGVYRELVDFEEYAGERVLISIRAMAKEADPADPTSTSDPVYVHSVDGITFELTVPKRINTPVIEKWEKSWKHERDNVANPDDPDDPGEIHESKSVEEFEEGGANGLKVTLTAGSNSIPPGGSSYLTKAYVFESGEDAQALQAALTAEPKSEEAIKTAMKKVVAYYPLLNIETGQWIPAGMEPEGSSQNQFSHTLTGLSAEHAGKYILFSARISSGAGMVSSQWVVQKEENTENSENANSFIWRLPYVKLPTPEVSAENGEREVEVRFTPNPDMGSGDDSGNGGTSGGSGNGGSGETSGNGGDSESGGTGGNGGEAGNGENSGNAGEAGSGETSGNGGEAGSGETSGNGGEAGSGETSGSAEEAGNGETSGNAEETGNEGTIGNIGNTETGNSDRETGEEKQTSSENTQAVDGKSEDAGNTGVARAIMRAYAANAAAGRTYAVNASAGRAYLVNTTAVSRASKREANAFTTVGRMGTRAAAEKAVYGVNARTASPITFRTLAASMDLITEKRADSSDKPTESADSTETRPTEGVEVQPTESTDGADSTETQPTDGADSTDGASGQPTESKEGAGSTDGASGQPTENIDGSDSTETQPTDGAGSTDDADSADGTGGADGTNDANGTGGADSTDETATHPKKNTGKTNAHAKDSADDEDSMDEQPTADAELYEDGEAAQADDLQDTEIWTAENTVLSFSSVKYADAYYFVLTDSDREVEVEGDAGSITTQTQEVKAEFKAVETVETDKTDPANPTSKYKVTVYGRSADEGADGSAGGNAGADAGGSGQWVEIGEKVWDGAADNAAEDPLELNLSEVLDDEEPFATYGKTVKGTYAVDISTSVPYEADLKTFLKITMQAGENGEDAVFTYTLSLPDSNRLSPPEDSKYASDGNSSIENSDSDRLRFTDSVRIWADMEQNEDADPTKWSEAYVKSEEWTLDFNN